MSTVNPLALEQLIDEDLASREQALQLRRRRVLEPISPTKIRFEGVEYVNFSSNNYLGLTHHPRLIEAGRLALARFGTGSGAAGLITGHSTYHESAERVLAKWKGTQAAVLLPSGYQANLAAVQTLAAIGERAGGARFLIDKLAHASLIDAVRATGEAAFRVFPHNGLGKLERLLKEAPANQLQVVLTESIFSMDGDAADLAGLARLKEKYSFVLLLDEAHGSGVYGTGGAGFAAEMGLQSMVDVSIVTLSKAMGGSGGAVCASEKFCRALLNHGRAFIYSTSVSPAAAAVAEAAVGVMRDQPELQSRVRELAQHVRAEIAELGYKIAAGDSPIVPIILGAEEAALAASKRLEAAGLIAPAVRPPTVPAGTSRLRLTLSAAHTDDEVKRLIDGLRSRI